MNKLKYFLITILLLLIVATPTFAVDIVTSSGVWRREGSAMLLNPSNLDIGSSASPVGDIYAGNLSITGITLTGNLDMSGNDIINIDNLTGDSAPIIVGAGTPNQATTDDDLFVSGEFEVDGKVFIDNIATITSGTLADITKSLAISATLPATASVGWNSIVDVQATSSNAGNNYPFNIDLLAGATGNSVYAAGRFINHVAGVGTTYISGGQSNYGLFANAVGSTTGSNIGAETRAYGGNTNIGNLGLAINDKAGANNIGVVGFGLNSTGVQVGGYFGLESVTPTYTSAALMADNGTTTSDIFVARDNGTPIFHIKDGGLMEFNGGLKMNYTAVSDTNYTVLVNDYIVGITALTASRTIALPPAATAGAGKIFVIKDESGGAGANNIIIDPNGAELIDGSATKLIAANYNGFTVYTNGTAWFTY